MMTPPYQPKLKLPPNIHVMTPPIRPIPTAPAAPYQKPTAERITIIIRMIIMFMTFDFNHISNHIQDTVAHKRHIHFVLHLS